ncbi:MAG: pyridoxal phosphate-dependent aminotransferase [Burkholderiales bacterium]|jgi:cystathionine beta-lyase|nr:pyridoxal phosphate-dependent aminotransferase [Burkholderiales bacterium]
MLSIAMKYNFDEVVSRKGTNSLKYDFFEKYGKPEDALPVWLADMDFRVPIEVTQKLIDIARHGIFGYTETKDDYFHDLLHWFSQRFDYAPEPEWLIKTPGVVFALAAAVRAYTETGDSVMIQQPVYPPFSSTVTDNRRNLVINPLVERNGFYHVDFDLFEKQLIEHKVKLFILCSPHNPVGRVWTKEELVTTSELCLKHRCLIVSDEIHCDFSYSGYTHRMLATLSPEIAERSIICTAPSKTFNLAGLQIANIFIQDAALRRKFTQAVRNTGYSQMNIMGLAACQYVYRYGHDWLNQLLAYLSDNLSFLRDFLKQRLPEIKLIEPQGTYLVWLDFRAFKMDDAQLNDWITHKAKLWLNKGTSFGCGGEGFQRINIACPRVILEKALTRLEHALRQ